MAAVQKTTFYDGGGGMMLGGGGSSSANNASYNGRNSSANNVSYVGTGVVRPVKTTSTTVVSQEGSGVGTVNQAEPTCLL